MKCQCQECGTKEGEMYIHSRCHPDWPLWISVKEDVITVTCAECDSLVTTFKIAPVVH
jgi:hypothetical protein